MNALEILKELWHHYQRCLDYGGPVPLWLAALEPRIREAVEKKEVPDADRRD